MTQVLKGAFNECAALTAEQLAKRLAAADHMVEQLTHVCAYAMQSRTAARALAWAAAHEVKIAFACLPVHVSGIYSVITGQVKLSHGYGKDGYVSNSAVESLTHEIRHAWQDKRGLLPHFHEHKLRFGKLETTQAQLALCEADAAAVGGMAWREVAWRDEHPPENYYSDSRRQVMRDLFMGWFDEEAAMYGEQTRRIHEFGITLHGPAAPMPERGVNPYDRAHVLELGRDFCGNNNYLVGLDADLLTKRLANTRDILRDYERSERTPQSGGEIRKVQMINRLWSAGRLQP